MFFFILMKKRKNKKYNLEILKYIVEEASFAYNRGGFSELENQRAEIEQKIRNDLEKKFSDNGFNLIIVPEIMERVMDYLVDRNSKANTRFFSITDFDKKEIFKFIDNFHERV